MKKYEESNQLEQLVDLINATPISNDGLRTIHAAIAFNHNDVMHVLINKLRIDINQKNQVQSTPLICALLCSNTISATMLVNHGADCHVPHPTNNRLPM